MPAQPPDIPGVRRSFVDARGVRFHVTEAGPVDGRPVIALHGWPQHHWVYRDLLADPPPGLRIIAPDLPGYGWSGPPPHRWAKEDVAQDVLALMDALGVGKALLVAHDWGGFVAYRMLLAAPERFDGYLVCNMAHPWQTPRTTLPHFWRFLAYQPFVASIGMALQQRTIVNLTARIDTLTLELSEATTREARVQAEKAAVHERHLAALRERVDAQNESAERLAALQADIRVQLRRDCATHPRRDCATHLLRCTAGRA
jgi:pimeloyl-ACP methyl ester carboxylesterase